MENLIDTLINDLSLNDNIQEIILQVERPDLSNLSNLSIITREVTQNNRIINNFRENRMISFQQIIENIQNLNNFSLDNQRYTVNNIIDSSNINNFINSTIDDKNKYKKVVPYYITKIQHINKCCPI